MRLVKEQMTLFTFPQKKKKNFSDIINWNLEPIKFTNYLYLSPFSHFSQFIHLNFCAEPVDL